MRYGPFGLDVLLDVVVVVLTAVMGVTLSLEHLSPDSPSGWVAPAAFLGLAVSLLWRRRSPFVVLWLTTAATWALLVGNLLFPTVLLDPEPLAVVVAWVPPTAPFVAYAALVYGVPGRVTWVLLAFLAVGTLLVTEPARLSEAGLRTATCTVGAALLGMYITTRHSLVRALVDRAQRAEREQGLLAERAREEERARLNSEIHNIVTHRVSLLVLQAGALRVSAEEESVRAAAEQMRSVGRLTLDELRGLLGVLSQDGWEGDGQDDGAMVLPPSPVAGLVNPTVDDLIALAAECRTAGVSVSMRVSGDPSPASPVVARIVYSVLRVILTNVRRHTPGSRIGARVHYGADGVRIVVRNTADGGFAHAELAVTGGGTGLLGLERRVGLVGGAFRAGRTGQGGFQVSVCLPAAPGAGGPFQGAPTVP